MVPQTQLWEGKKSSARYLKTLISAIRVKEIIMMTTDVKEDMMCFPPVISLVLLLLLSIIAKWWQYLWETLQ